ncbi:MAG: hypothetical protein IJ003_04500 [Candidatus Gastranaerophilales bacterium]|nr:hypothetical protein [Candidatus Gastranaerophilales bacterium]
MSSENFIKNITSKDLKLSHKTIEALIKQKDSSLFSELCEKSEFIFPFLKERIIKDFVKLITENDLDVVFEFSKIYCSDFEDLIVNSWLKFACEDLTDKILEILNNGTNEQKAYAASYFCHINDSLAIELLNQNAMSDFEPLNNNCAKALSKFGDKDILNKAKDIIVNSNDDFEKISAFNYVISYGGAENIKFVFEHAINNSFETNIIENILNQNDLEFFKKNFEKSNITKIFNILINAYPEDITLDTILYYQIYDFIELLNSYNNEYSTNLLLLAKERFGEFLENDIYLFDLDKNTKEELKTIKQKLDSYNLKFNKEELNLYNVDIDRFDCALDVVKETKVFDCCELLADFVNKNMLEEKFIPKVAEILKDAQKTNLIDKNSLQNIENINIKALVESYL